jgi:polyisoprenoid-binding protein YceI
VFAQASIALASGGAEHKEEQMPQTAVQGREYQGVSIPPVGTYELDRVHTVVGFVARHMLSKVRGQFTDVTGTIEVGDSPEDSRVDVEVKTESITTHTEKRDQHLMSGDFLEIEKHPVLTFKGTALRPTGGTSFELDGDLTIKDVTRPVTVSGEFLGWGPNMEGEPMLAASAKTTIDREDWGMTWNMAVETGGFLVGKKVDLEIEFEAHRVG